MWRAISRAGSEDLDELLDRLTPKAAELVRAVDELIRRTDAGVVAVHWPHQRAAGYGPGRPEPYLHGAGRTSTATNRCPGRV